MKLCKDCKWISATSGDYYVARCTYPPRASLVSGLAERYCRHERESGIWFSGKCGPQGKNWEAR